MNRAQVAECERHLRLIEASAKLLPLADYIAQFDPKISDPYMLELAKKTLAIGTR